MVNVRPFSENAVPLAASGWQKVMTSDGRPYYQNTITRETRWAKPDGWEETEDDVDSYGASRSESDRHRPRVSVASSDGAKGTDREAGKGRFASRSGVALGHALLVLVARTREVYPLVNEGFHEVGI